MGLEGHAILPVDISQAHYGFDLPSRPQRQTHFVWSSQVGDFGLRMAGAEGHAILPVDISLNGASFLCVVGAPNRHPPYRIDNRCAPV